MTINYWRAAALALAISAIAAPASAMPGSKSVRTVDPVERFTAMDASKDGKVSWEEFNKARPNLNKHAFDMIDAGKDGGIDLDEWKAFSVGHGGAAKAPDMGSMMKSMGGMGKSLPAEGAIEHDHDAKAAPAMPLIMPPVKSDAAPAKQPGMPLIMPPKPAN